MKYFFILGLFLSQIAFAQQLEDLGSAINTEYNEIHPVISPDGQTLYFVRESHPSNTFGKDGSLDVWYSDNRSDGRWSIARKMPNTINKDKFNDLFCISPDGNTILIRGVYKNGKKEDEVGISICKRTKTGWTQPEKLDIPKLSVKCKGKFLAAFLSNNGKSLLLSFSEKKNSTNEDLYYSLLDRQGKWSEPEALGEDINTAAIETGPFLAADNATLYFASDRKDGLGGTDIWVSKRVGRNWNRWSKPTNLGDKINTDQYDFHFSITADGGYAYMSTRKNTIGKGDIVRYKLRDPNKETPVASLQTGESEGGKGKNGQDPLKELTSPNPIVMISGKVIDTKTKQPIEAQIIYETFPGGEEAGVATTNPLTGEYKIVLPYGERFTVRAVAKNFIAIGKTIDLTNIGDFKEFTGEDLEMAPILEGVSVTLKNIFFEFGKATLEAESFPELNRLIEVMKENTNMTIEVHGHTDNVGPEDVNLKLSQQRADAVRDYLQANAIPSNRVSSVGFGETKPIAANETTEGQAQNRRVEFVILKK